MKRLISKLFALSIMVYFFPIIILLTISPQYTHEYNASFIDKINRLESIKEPKIVLVSNSNVAFGINSSLVEKEIKMPVVNLGLHGGLGNAFNERMALLGVNKGDIVVISHLTYEDDDTISDPELALLTVENYFRYWKIFRLKDYPRIICSLPKYSYKCLIRFITKADKETTRTTCFARSMFNEYGDNIFPRNIEAGESAPRLSHPAINKTCINRINKFTNYCNSKGVVVVIAGSQFLSGIEGFNLEEYKTFQKELENSVICPIISDFTDYIFDKKYFYTSNLHMTNDGANIRTIQLIKDLEKFLNLSDHTDM